MYKKVLEAKYLRIHQTNLVIMIFWSCWEEKWQLKRRHSDVQKQLEMTQSVCDRHWHCDWNEIAKKNRNALVSSSETWNPINSKSIELLWVWRDIHLQREREREIKSKGERESMFKHKTQNIIQAKVKDPINWLERARKRTVQNRNELLLWLVLHQVQHNNVHRNWIDHRKHEYSNQMCTASSLHRLWWSIKVLLVRKCSYKT